MRNEFTAIFEYGRQRRRAALFRLLRCGNHPAPGRKERPWTKCGEKLRDAIKSVLQAHREKTMRDILFDFMPSDAGTQEVIAVQETIAMQWVPYVGDK